MQKITPFLWFDGNAEEAVNFYTSIFKNSKITAISRYSDAGPGPKGSVMTATFQLQGQEFVALNGGPTYQLTPAISFVVNATVGRNTNGMMIILAVAVIKTILVGSYFMHLIIDWPKLYYLIFPTFILATMFVIVLLPDIVFAWHPGAAATSPPTPGVGP